MLICVTGPAAAGKSSLAKAVASLAPDVAARVPVDWFFVPRAPEQSLDDFWSQPLRYDWPLLDAALATEDPAHLTQRDREWGTDLAQRTAHLRITHEQGLADLPGPPDLVLDAAAPLADNARTLLDHVSGRTGQDGRALAETTSAYQRAESLGVRTSVS